MKCDNSYLSLISGHLDGCNSEIEEKRLQQHLKTCRHCRELLEIMKGNDALLVESTELPPADLTERIMSAVAKEPKKQRSRKRFYFTTAAAGLAAAAMLCFAVMGDNFKLLPTKSDSVQNEAIHTYTYSSEIMEPQSEVSYAGELEDSPALHAPERTPASEPVEPTAYVAEDAPTEVEPSKAPDVTQVPASTKKASDVPENTKSVSDQPQYSIEPPVGDEGEDEPVGFALPATITQSFYKNPIDDRFGYESGSGIPTLVIWDAEAKSLQLPFGTEKREFGQRGSSPNKRSLYDHFASALFTLRQPSFIGSNGDRLLTPAYNSEIYTLSYEALCELFTDCTGKFELAVYFPKTPDLESDCQLILITTPKAVSKGSISFATE